MRKIKPNLNLKQIGEFEFTFGLLIWFGTGFSLYLLFQYFLRISYELSTLFLGDIHTIPLEDQSFHNTFFIALLGTSLGFGFATYLWMSRIFIIDFRIKRLKRISQANSIFIIGVAGYMLIRFFSVLILVNLTQIRFDLFEYYGILIYVLPLYIFLYNWMFISKAYKSTRPILISFGVWIIFSLILTLI